MYKVIIVEDNHLIRKGLTMLLSGIGNCDVIETFATGQEMVNSLNHSTVPDLAFIDIHLPGMDGFAISAWLKEHHPTVRSIAMYLDETEEEIDKMLRSGCVGAVSKTALAGELKHVMNQAIK